MELEELRPSDLNWLSAFRGLTEEEGREILAVIEEVSVARGRPIYKEGTPHDALYAILDGAVEIRLASSNGKVQTLARLTKGSVLGEASFLTGEASSTSVVAAEDSLLLRLAHEDLRRLLQEGRVAAYKVVYNLGRVAGQRLREVNRKLVDILGKEEVSAHAKLEELAKLRVKLFTEWSF